MKKILIINFIILSISCFSQSPKNSSHKILKTDLTDENLKGTVKSYHLTVKYLDLRNKNNNGNRIATPKGYDENVFVEFNKSGLMTSSLLGVYNDSLELEPMESKDLIEYKYNEFDLIYKSKLTSQYDYPPTLSQQFNHIFPDRSDYYKYDDDPESSSVVKNVYGLNFDENKNSINDMVFFRHIYYGSKSEANEKEPLTNQNIQNKWHYDYNSAGLLKKINITKESDLDVIIKYFRYQLKTNNTEITFEYDKQNRLIKYSVFSVAKDKKEEVGSVVYSYNPKYGFVESETIYQKYPDEYYLSNVHYRTYNKQGDLIANLLQVEPKYEQLVRKKQLYLDKYYEYNYDENDNWIECKIRVNNPTSEISAIMERKIQYFKD